MALTTSLEAWTALTSTVERWFHEPDLIAIRAALACAAALDLDQPSAWLMIVAPPSTGKTAIHFPLLRAYPRVVETSDINLPGLLSLAKGQRGKGLLDRLGVRGLWLIKDFGAILTMRDEKRTELLGALREIYDGSWGRNTGLGNEEWVGRVNIVAASTPIVERFHRVNAELGDRFLTIRLQASQKLEQARKAAAQDGATILLIRRELQTAAHIVLTHASHPTLDDTFIERLYSAARIIALCRTPTNRDWRDDLQEIGATEGFTRVLQQLMAIVTGDAAIGGQMQVDEHQFPLLTRLIYDSLPLHRGNLLRQLIPGIALNRQSVFEATGENWPRSFSRAVEELSALGAIQAIPDGPHTTLKLSPHIAQWVENAMPQNL